MHRFEMDFEFLKDEAGNVNGFSLVAQPHTESEFFCATFPRAFTAGEADIDFKEDEILFKHPKCQFSGTHQQKIDPEEMKLFAKWLEEVKQKGHKVTFVGVASFTPGFKLVEVP